MSCITEILKRKADLPFILSPGKRVAIEGGGTYKSYEYLITFADMGHRCGYVAISPNLPDYKDESDYPDYDVHGGITFFDKAHLAESILGHSCEDKWLGFDCGHYNDLPDIECMKSYFNPISEYSLEYAISRHTNLLHANSEVRSKEYVEEQCKLLIEQLIVKELEQ